MSESKFVSLYSSTACSESAVTYFFLISSLNGVARLELRPLYPGHAANMGMGVGQGRSERWWTEFLVPGGNWIAHRPVHSLTNTPTTPSRVLKRILCKNVVIRRAGLTLCILEVSHSIVDRQVVTESSSLPYSLHANAWILPDTSRRQLPSISFPNRH